MASPAVAPGLLLITATLAGCCDRAENPSFPLTVAQARDELQNMAEHPRPLPRPLVVLGGWADPGLAADHLADTFRPLLIGAQILEVSFGASDNFEEARHRLIAAIDAHFPSDQPHSTVEVDVVASSMGGLIAMYAADPAAGDRAVRIHRLFTIATPFRGANMARLAPGTDLIRAMRPRSTFLQALNASAASRDYEIVPYVRLGDLMVGVENTAPVGEVPIWVPCRFLQPSHLMGFRDPRPLADIARRLRGEASYIIEPRVPPPAGRARELENSRARGFENPRTPDS